MIRFVAPVAALVLLCACSRHAHAPAAPAAPTADSAPKVSQQAPPAPESAPSAAVQSETEQARASQESAGADNGESHERSDASLEQIASAGAAAQLPAGKWKAGSNYDVLVPAQPTDVSPGKVEVMEVFWLACPHCYDLEPDVQRWLKSKPAYVEFVRVPVMWQPMHRAHARLFYTLQALGRPDLVGKAFDTIHQDVQNRAAPLVGDSDETTFRMQQQFAVQNGVSADDFAKAYNSFAVNNDLERAEEITQRYHVTGVPFFAVNGKYTTDVEKAGNESKLTQLLTDLAASEHRH
jgi:protein dithiol oxidoreductase (disulfide-forming)